MIKYTSCTLEVLTTSWARGCKPHSHMHKMDGSAQPNKCPREDISFLGVTTSDTRFHIFSLAFVFLGAQNVYNCLKMGHSK